MHFMNYICFVFGVFNLFIFYMLQLISIYGNKVSFVNMY